MSGLIPPTRPHRIDRAPLDEPHLLRWEHDRHGAPAQNSAAGLSRSELDILEDAANGLTTRESASRRSKSAETVKSQRTSVLAKLGARNMVQAVAMTVRDREVPGDDAETTRFA